MALPKFLSRSKSTFSQKANVQQVLTGMTWRPTTATEDGLVKSARNQCFFIHGQPFL